MLELSKCFTYVVNWDQPEDGRHKAKREIHAISITKSQTGLVKETKQKTPGERHKTLGCHENPAMDMKMQAAELRKKAYKISQLTCLYGLSTNTTRTAYFIVYLSVVQYPLTSFYILKKLLDLAQTKATRRFLRCQGFNQNMLRVVAYAPRLLGGLGMQRMYTTQCIYNTMQMPKYLQARTTVGKVFKVGTNWLQRWAGLSQCVMRRPTLEIPPTTSKIMGIKEFLTTCRA